MASLNVTTPEATSRSLNIALLERLRQAGGGYVPIDQLREFSTHAQAELAELIEFGFGIEIHPVHGVAYRGPSERLCPDQLEANLGTQVVGRRIAVWNRVTSTNDLAARASRSMANDGLVILAEEQSAGRGRRGREWIAPPRSSILMSVLLFPPARVSTEAPESTPAASWLTALAAVAVAETVSTMTGLRASIKWPNDVRIDGRKVAGILVERPAPVTVSCLSELSTHSPRMIRPAIIGIGLNVNLTADRFAPAIAHLATSLRAEMGNQEPLDRSEISRGLIRSLDRWYSHCLNHGLQDLSHAWTSASEHVGKVMRVDAHDGSRVGRIVALDLDRGVILARGCAEGRGTAEPDQGDTIVPMAQIQCLTEVVDVLDRERVMVDSSSGKVHS